MPGFILVSLNVIALGLFDISSLCCYDSILTSCSLRQDTDKCSALYGCSLVTCV